MSKLIPRAFERYDSARLEVERAKKYPDRADAIIDGVCFNIQQSLEFYLKGIVELQGDDYVPTHDLRAQINRINTKDQHLLDVIDKIASNVVTFNSWETQSRYLENFVPLLRDVKLGLELCGELNEICNKLVRTEKR